MEADDPDDELYLAVWANSEHIGLADPRDPSEYLHDVSGVIGLADSGGNLQEDVGRFSISLLDLDAALNARVSLFDVFDQRAETMQYYEVLFDGGGGIKREVLELMDCEDEYLAGGVLAFNRLTINREHRGRAFGLQAMHTILHRYRMGAGLVAMKPYPLQFEGEPTPEELRARNWDTFSRNYPSSIAKLRRHYGRLGFKLVPRTQVMVLPLVGPLPEIAGLESLAEVT